MRIAFILLALGMVGACRQSSVIGENQIELLVQRQLLNNQRDIEQVGKELVMDHIDTIRENEELLHELKEIQAGLEGLYASRNNLPADRMIRELGTLYDIYLKYPSSHTYEQLDIGKLKDPFAMLLYMAQLESDYILDARSRYKTGTTAKFTSLFFQMLPDRFVVNRGEKVKGSISYAALGNRESDQLIRQIMVNGHKATLSKDGWIYEFVPEVKSNAQVVLLEAEVVLKNGKLFKTVTPVFIK